MFETRALVLLPLKIQFIYPLLTLEYVITIVFLIRHVQHFSAIPNCLSKSSSKYERKLTFDEHLTMHLTAIWRRFDEHLTTK